MTETRVTRDGEVEPRRSGGSGWLIAIIVLVALVVAAFAFGFVNIDQVREGKAPTVKLETSGGQAPVFDVETAKINVGSKQETVETPTLDIGSKKSTVDVPTISIERTDNPDAKDK